MKLGSATRGATVAALAGLATLLLPGLVALAAEYRVRAFIEPARQITSEDSILLVLQVEGDAPVASIRPPRLPEFVNLRVVAGPNQQVNTSWINGRTSSTLQYRYTLMPVRAGNAEIPELTLEVDGTAHKTAPIRFEVLPTRPGSRPQAPDRSRGGSQPSAATTRSPDFFVEAEIPATTVWVGQSVPLSLALWMGEPLYNVAFRDQPSLTNFWVEELDVDPAGEVHREQRGGRPYNVMPVKRLVLVPQAAGRFAIEPFVLELQARKRSSDPFDSFFSLGRLESIVRQSEPVALEVKPLPEQGRPADFSGAVGRFELSASIDRAAAAVNDAVAVTATVEGEGFLGAVTAPVLAAPSGFKVFDPEVRTATSARRGALVSRKTWEWIVVPTAPGQVELPELRFSYFDPTSGSYRTARQALGTIAVERGELTGETAVARGDLELERRELAFIKPLRGTLRLETPRAQERSSFAPLLLAPLVWAPLLVWVGRRRSRLLGNRKFARARRAGARARKRLRAAARHGAGQTGVDFHEEVARALVGYVADRFDRAAAGLTYEMADDLLASRGFDTTLRRRFRSCLETCDFARFVPASGASERRTEVLHEANELLQAMEKAS